MPNMFRKLAEFMSDQRHANTVEEVTYSRDGETPLTISVTIGRVEGEDLAIADMIVDGEQIDFIVRRADIDFGAGPVDPAKGDTIAFANGTRTLTYTVLPDATDAVFRACDEYGFDLRIHTEKTGDATS